MIRKSWSKVCNGIVRGKARATSDEVLRGATTLVGGGSDTGHNYGPHMPGVICPVSDWAY